MEHPIKQLRKLIQHYQHQYTLSIQEAVKEIKLDLDTVADELEHERR